MKTAISVPNQLFDQAERLARRTGRTRSDVYSAALREYVARHDPDEITEGLDRVVESMGKAPEDALFASVAARRTLATTEW
jgi:predicted transcriptional regulator